MPLNSIPPTCTVDGAARSSGRPRGTVPRRRRLLGRRDPGQHRRPARAARRRRLRVQVLHDRLRAWTSSRRCRAEQLEEYLGVLASYGAKMIVHAEDSTAIERAPGAARAALRRLPRLAAARVGERRHRAPHRGGPAHRGVGAPAAPVQLGRRADAAHRPPRGHPDDRRDLPALPGVRGRRRSPTAPRSSSAARRSGRSDNREELWARAGSRRHRLHRLRPLAVHRRAQAARPRRVRRGLGRDLLAADRAAGRVDRGPAARPHAGRRGPLDGAAARRDRPAAAQGPHRPRLPRRLRRVRARTTRSSSTRAGCTTATPSPRTRSARWPASSAAPGCAAAGSPATSRGGR